MPYGRSVVLIALLSMGAHAQWLNFPTPGTPRTADGKPNLNARTPRALDGKPDLSGVWMHETTTVAEVRRLFGNRFESEISLAPPGMEIGTQHKYAFDILLDYRPEEAMLRPAGHGNPSPQRGRAQALPTFARESLAFRSPVSSPNRSRSFRRPG